MNDSSIPEVNIRLSNLSKTYRSKVGPVLTIPRTLQIRAGEVVAVLGYSASGKSTLLNQIGLIDTPDVGTEIAIRYNSRLISIKQLTEKEKDHVRKKLFGFIFQAGHLLSHFSVESNIAVPLYLNDYPKVEIHSKVDQLVQSAFSERPPQRQYPRTLSGGQYMRAAVMRALAHDPTILLADEPTGSLDPITGRALMTSIVDGWMNRRRSEKSFVFVTHDYRYAYDYADRILVLAKGLLMLELKRNGRSFCEHINTSRNTPLTFDHPRQLLEAVETMSIASDFGATAMERPEPRAGKIPPPSAPQQFRAKAESQKQSEPIGVPAPFLFKFSLKYAVQELIFNAKMTLMNVATVALLTFSAFVIGGILSGAEQMIKRQLDGDPLLKRLTLYASSSTLSGEISDNVITGEHIDKILSIHAQLGRLSFQEPVSNEEGELVWPLGNVVSHALPWSDVNLRFYTADGDLTAPLPGRTVHQDDPLLELLNYPHGQTNQPLYTTTFSYSDEKGRRRGFPFGIIVSDSILEKVLRYSVVAPPEDIDILFSRGRRTTLQLLGTASNIPDGEFLVTEPFQAAYLQSSWTPEDLFDRVYWGPFTVETLRQCREKVSRFLQLKKAVFPLLGMRLSERLAPGEYWFTFFIDSDQKDDLWEKADFERNLLVGLEYQLPQGVDMPDFTYPAPAHKTGVEEDFNHGKEEKVALTLGVYFNRIEDVIKAPPLLSQMNLGLEMGNIEYVKQLVHMKHFGYLIFITVFALVGVTAGLNIFLSFYQNIHGKIAEIGLLRAIGTSRAAVSRFYLIEAFIIWLPALLLGGGLAWLLGPVGGNYVATKYEIYSDTPLFSVGPELTLAVLVISLLLCLASTALATQRVVSKITPADAVRYRG